MAKESSTRCPSDRTHKASLMGSSRSPKRETTGSRTIVSTTKNYVTNNYVTDNYLTNNYLIDN